MRYNTMTRSARHNSLCEYLARVWGFDCVRPRPLVLTHNDNFYMRLLFTAHRDFFKVAMEH